MSSLNAHTEEDLRPLFRQIGRSSVIKFQYSPLTKRRRKNCRKCKINIVALPHVSLRLSLVISSADNDNTPDEKADEVITKDKPLFIFKTRKNVEILHFD